MALYKPKYRDKKTGKIRSSAIWWYEFEWHGKRIRESTKVRNERQARNIEAAHRTRLAEGRVGIELKPPAPTLADFASKFKAAVETTCAEKPATVRFYREKLARLLKDKALSGARLDAIEEGVIGEYVQRRVRKTSSA